MMVNIFTIAMSVIEIVIYLYFIRGFLPTRRYNKIKSCVIIIFACVIHVIKSYFNLGLYFSLTIISIESMLLLLLLYDDKVVKCIFIFMIYLSIVLVSDVMTSAVISIIYGYMYGEVNTINYMLGNIIMDIWVVLFCIYVSHFLAPKVKDMNDKCWIKIMMCPLLGFVAIIILDGFAQAAGATKMYLFLMLITFVFIFIAFNYFVFELFKSYTNDIIINQLKDLMRSQELQYNVLIENEKNIRTLKHNIDDYMSVMKNMIEHGIEAEPRELMNELEGIAGDIEYTAYTSCITIDAILNMYRQYANNRGIKYIIQSQGDAQVNIDSLDITTILCNLIKNALEASEKTNEKFIAVNIKVTSEIVQIIIENSSLQVTIHNNLLPTSKKSDIHIHGLGLLSVEKIIQKYDGIFSIDYEGGIFTSLAYINNRLPIVNNKK